MSKLGNYFSFTKGEKRGTAVLLIIIVLLVFSIQFIDRFKLTQQTDFSEFEQAIDEFEKAKQKIQKTDSPIELISVEYFNFNPNLISDSSWKKLGFKDWQIKTINNYKSKGGEWRTKKDVRKIYGLNDSIFNLLEPYILLPDTFIYESKKQHQSNAKNLKSESDPKPKTSIIIDINKADTSDFKNLKGIGSGYAKRIVKYREALGGFVSVNQIKEVYGIKEDLYTCILPFLNYSTAYPIKKININKCDADELKSHPYINWNLANAIVNYRKNHGTFAEINDIKKIHLITEEIYTKIAPYLKTD